MATSNTKMTIKLVIDKVSNKLIFAEASKDFVDFLFFLLSLPIGTATKLLTSNSMVGSFGNLFASFTNLTQTNNCLDFMLLPLQADNETLPYVNRSSFTSQKLYTCWNSECRVTITDEWFAECCPSCSKKWYQEIKFSDAFNTTSNSKGFGKDSVTYMISDDLSVTQMSTKSIISTMNDFNVSCFDMLEEREVNIGNQEGLRMLKASFLSKTVLSDVFLRQMEK